MSIEDAFVNVLLQLVDLLWDRVVLLEKGNVGGLSIMEVNWQKRNSGRGELVFKPGERGHTAAGSKALK